MYHGRFYLKMPGLFNNIPASYLLHVAMGYWLHQSGSKERTSTKKDPKESFDLRKSEQEASPSQSIDFDQLGASEDLSGHNRKHK